MVIDVKELNYRALNEKISGTKEPVVLDNCCGQRFVAAGMSDKNITINGVPGNALGAY